MPTFQYSGKRTNGEVVEGTVRADTMDAAAAQVQSQDIWLTDLRPVSERVGVPRGGRWNPWYAFFPLSKIQLAALFRQLASLFRAGVPAYEALASVRDRVGSVRLRALLRKISSRMLDGRPLSAHFREHDAAFGPFVPAMLEVGERTGRLDIVCDEIAEQYELEASLARSVLPQKLYYGGLIFLAAMMFPLITAWKNWMVARVSESPDAGARLTAIGQTAIVTFAVLVGLLLALWVGRALLTLPWLVCVRDGLRLYTPLSGAIVRRGALARFCKTAAAMYQAGVPVAEAMEAAALAMGNCLLARRALAQIPPLRDGGSVADAVAASRLFEPTFAGMIATGEQSGTLPETLYQVAREYEQRRDSGRRVLVIGSIGIGLLLGAAIIGAVVVKFYTTYYGSMMREMLDAVE